MPFALSNGSSFLNLIIESDQIPIHCTRQSLKGTNATNEQHLDPNGKVYAQCLTFVLN